MVSVKLRLNCNTCLTHHRCNTVHELICHALDLDGVAFVCEHGEQNGRRPVSKGRVVATAA